MPKKNEILNKIVAKFGFGQTAVCQGHHKGMLGIVSPRVGIRVPQAGEQASVRMIAQLSLSHRQPSSMFRVSLGSATTSPSNSSVITI